MTLRYVLSQGGPAIVLSEPVLATFDRFRQRSLRDKEAGGQLFARFEAADTVILEASGPKWFDRRHRTGFKPNRWLQQREIRDRRAHGLHYVGDWHTHPAPIPRPSNLDLQSMKECFMSSKHDLRSFLLIIIGMKPAPAGIYVALVSTKVVQLYEQPFSNVRTMV